jgi:uncharacterized protein YndB with AHSA1/START domain
MADVLQIQERTVVRSQPQRVWELIVDSEDRVHWWPYLDLEAREGGEVREVRTGDDGPEVTLGVVVEVLPGDRLVFAWKDEGWTSPTTVQIVVSAHDDGTEVVVAESGFERLNGAEGVAEGRHEEWTKLLSYLRTYAEK